MADLTFDRSQEDLIRRSAQALRLMGPEIENKLTDAIINPLTTVQGVIDAINSAARVSPNSEYNHRVAIEALKTLQLYNILTDAEVASANTFAGLITEITEATDLIDQNQGEAMASEYGGDVYLGNYATESTL